MLRLIFCLLVWAIPMLSWGQSIGIRQAEIRSEDEALVLDADFELSFTHTLEEALQRGVPLYFTLELNVARSRWLFDDSISSQNQTWRIAYSPLTRDYRLSSGLYHTQVRNLDLVARQIARVRGRKIIDKVLLKRNEKYLVSIRLLHDIGQLPKPLQVSALSNREWSLESETLKLLLPTP
ncbi:MAG: hypothetical protein RLZZ502_1869 [Pseudomonadota bacterium]|jgi:hypothetical protein